MISLNYRASGPIYSQLKEQLRKLILSGAIAEGEKLPSVRELAGELAINPNTIMRAYRELEAEGYVYTIQGKGCFAGSLGQVEDSRKTELLEAFRTAAGELLHLGVDPQELHTVLTEEELQTGRKSS
ncbi:MAG: GntR family transcriptional regulator [Oscillospiraceae bacterium]|nr:GntR family transcriptional regulator [Oscillospiraceae bacterium]